MKRLFSNEHKVFGKIITTIIGINAYNAPSPALDKKHRKESKALFLNDIISSLLRILFKIKFTK